MLILYLLLSLIIIFCGFISFSLNRKHLLMILLSLEFIILSLYFWIFIYLRFFNFEFFFRIIFLTIRVCEGALGLRILVMIVRCYGNDNFQRFNLLW